MSPAGGKNAPEAKAREKIDALLAQSGWLVQDYEEMNLTANDGVAVREFTLEKGHGFADYLLFVDGIAVGVVEAKPAGYSLTSVEVQAKKYVEGLPVSLTAPHKPLPFAYISTGEETVFINALDPQPRSRSVFTFHRPETQREWLTSAALEPAQVLSKMWAACGMEWNCPDLTHTKFSWHACRQEVCGGEEATTLRSGIQV
jgi:type I restriction enzyme R subunit